MQQLDHKMELRDLTALDDDHDSERSNLRIAGEFLGKTVDVSDTELDVSATIS